MMQSLMSPNANTCSIYLVPARSLLPTMDSDQSHADPPVLSCRTGPSRTGTLAQGFEPRADLLCKELRLFPRREVPAFVEPL
jgi:hypothetical protein